MTVTPLSFRFIAARLDGAGLLVHAPNVDVTIRGITDDSRAVSQGDLFCAWTGTSSDSHTYLAPVQAAGGVAAIVEHSVESVTLPQIVVRDGRRAAAVAAAALHGEPQEDLILAGVTGTNGKTTTVWILRHLLSGWYRTASLGTLGVRTGAETGASASDSLTTPGPVALSRTLRALVDDGFEALAMEVSSHSLHQGRVEALRFDVTVFTNLTRDHLDYHETMDAYRDAKLSLTGLMRPDATVVVNADEPVWRSISAPRVLQFSTQTASDVHAEQVEPSAAGVRFTLHAVGQQFPVVLPLLGTYNVENALGAASACIGLGLPPGRVAERLSSVPQVPGRLERIADKPCPVLADYAHSPDALARALTTLRPLVGGRLILVFGAGGDRDHGKRPEMGAAAQEHADLAIVTSDNPRTEKPDAIIDEIVAGMRSDAYVRITDRRAAIAHALQTARADDLVLLAGKGHEDYQIVGTAKHPFDERVIVRELLAERGMKA